MKICMLASSYPRYPADCNGFIVGSLARALVRLGHQVHVVAPYDAAVVAMDQGGVHVHRFRYAPTRGLHLAGHGRSLEADVRMKRVVPLLMPGFALAAMGHVLALHRRERFDLLHAHWALPGGAIAALVAKWTRLPLLITLHGSDIYVAEHSQMYARAARFGFRQARRVTAVSEDLGLRAVALGLDPGRLLAIPPGPEVARYGAGDGSGWRQRLGIPPSALVVGTLGRLVYKKGFKYLIAAMSAIRQAVPNAYCVIGGDGDLRQELEEQARELGLSEWVRLVGHVDWQDTPNFYAMCDVVAVPSVVDQAGNVDGLPLVLEEAMASGLPVVASRVAGIPDIVTDGVNGLLVPGGDVEALSQALIRVLQDSQLRARLGAHGRQDMLEHYSIESMARRFEQLYAEMVAERQVAVGRG
jgi:glycosyltransferase involved in cell wall biosynthesis